MLLAGGKVFGEEGVAGGEWHLLRTRLDFLLMHSMMLWGKSTRRAELPDLCAYDLPSEGSECLALILRIGQGKSIPLADGGNSRRQHYHGALRSRDVVLCPLGALAHWLVLRWDFLLEKRPDFRDRSFDISRRSSPGAWRDLRRRSPTKHRPDGLSRLWMLSASTAPRRSTPCGSPRHCWPTCERSPRTRQVLYDSWPLILTSITLIPTTTDHESRRMGTWRLGH